MVKAEVRIKGHALSKGIAIGQPFFHGLVDDLIDDGDISKDHIEIERMRFSEAVKATVAYFDGIKHQLESEFAAEGAAIIESQIELLNDEQFVGQVDLHIQNHSKKAEFAIQQVVNILKAKFQTLNDLFFLERFSDVEDVSKRLLIFLKSGVKYILPPKVENSVLFMNSLSPSETAEASDKKVLAIVTEYGSAHAHAAILARAKDIPYVTNIPVSVLKGHSECFVIVDGTSGELIINPTKKTLSKYQKLLNELLQKQQNLIEAEKTPAKTKDGLEIKLFANLDSIEETKKIVQFGGKGIGLFRSENMLIPNQTILSEDEQFEMYKALVESMQGLPVTIRMFDIGRDKYPKNSMDKNIDKSLYFTQLKAIYRAAEFGKINVLFPMISSVAELKDIKKLVALAAKDLNSKETINIGCMIELPAAVIMADELAKECDFFSIGTNDLIHYALGVDRSDHTRSYLYRPTNPAILRLLAKVIEAGKKSKIAVSVCGELASNPKYIPLLIGLGIINLSLATRFIPLIREVVKGINYQECKELVEKAMLLSSADEIDDLLEEYLEMHPFVDSFYH